MSDVVSKMVQLGNEAASQGRRPERIELSSADYAAVRAYVEERATIRGEDVVAELERHNPMSPYWGSPTRAERLKGAAIRWHLDGCSRYVDVVEVPDMIGGPIVICEAP